MIDSGAMPAKKKASKPEQDAYSVGDRLQVRLSAGRIVEATVKAVIERTDGKRLQVDLRTRPRSWATKYRWPKFRLLAVAHVQITLFLERMRFWRGTADAHGQRAACQPGCEDTASVTLTRPARSRTA
jgi:hypothetical protein